MQESKLIKEKGIKQKEAKARKDAKKLLPKHSIFGKLFSSKDKSTSKLRVGEAIYTRGDKMVDETRKEILRLDPEAIKNPNDLLRRATVKVYTDMNRMIEKEMAMEVKPPPPAASLRNEDGSRYTKLHNPMSDVTLTTAEKLKMITNVSKPYELSKILLRPPIATQCHSRLQFWVPLLKDIPRDQLIAHLLYVAVAHYNLSFLNQMILSALPEIITIQHGGFIDQSLLCLTRTNKLLRGIQENIKDQILRWSLDFTCIFEQLLKATCNLQKQDGTIMSYEEAVMLLIHYTYNSHFNLWPTHCANGSAQFRDFAYIQESSHTIQTEKAINKMLTTERAESTLLHEKSELYYKIMIDAIQQSPNAPISMTDEVQRRAIYSQAMEHPINYHRMVAVNTGMIPNSATSIPMTYNQKLAELENMETEVGKEIYEIRAEIDLQTHDVMTQTSSIVHERIKMELDQNLRDAMNRRDDIITRRAKMIRENTMSPPIWQSSPRHGHNEGFTHQQQIPYAMSIPHSMQIDNSMTAYDPNRQEFATDTNQTVNRYGMQYPISSPANNQYQPTGIYPDLNINRYSVSADAKQSQQHQSLSPGHRAGVQDQLNQCLNEQQGVNEGLIQASDVTSSFEEINKPISSRPNEGKDVSQNTGSNVTTESESKPTNKQDTPPTKRRTRSDRTKIEEKANANLEAKLELAKDKKAAEEVSRKSKLVSTVKFRPVGTNDGVNQMNTVTEYTPDQMKRYRSRYQTYPVYKVGEDFRTWYAVLYTIVYRLHNNDKPSEGEMCEYLMEKLPTEIQTMIFNNPRIECDNLTEIQAFIVDKYAQMTHPKQHMNKLAGITMKRGTFQESMDEAEMKVGALVQPDFNSDDSTEMIAYKKQQARLQTDKMICQHILPALNRDEPDIYDDLVQSGIIDIKSMDQDYDKLKENLVGRDARHLERNTEVDPKKFKRQEQMMTIGADNDNRPSAPLLGEQDKKMMREFMNAAAQVKTMETIQQAQLRNNNASSSNDSSVAKNILQYLDKLSAQSNQAQTTSQNNQKNPPWTNQNQKNYNNKDATFKKSWHCRMCSTNEHTIKNCPNFTVIKRDPVNQPIHKLLLDDKAYCKHCQIKGHWPNRCNIWRYIKSDQVEPNHVVWVDPSQ